MNLGKDNYGFADWQQAFIYLVLTDYQAIFDCVNR